MIMQEGHSRPEKKTAAIISGSNEVTSVVAYNNESNDRGEDIHVLIPLHRNIRVSI
jgi:hypothetical protein